MPNSVQIAATDSEHVEPDPSDNLPSKQDGSEQMPLLNDHDSNHSGNITNLGSEDVAQQLAIGYVNVVAFSLGHTYRIALLFVFL